MAKARNVIVVTPAEYKAIQWAVGNFAQGDKYDCGNDWRRLQALMRAEDKLASCTKMIVWK